MQTFCHLILLSALIVPCWVKAYSKSSAELFPTQPIFVYNKAAPVNPLKMFAFGLGKPAVGKCSPHFPDSVEKLKQGYSIYKKLPFLPHHMEWEVPSHSGKSTIGMEENAYFHFRHLNHPMPMNVPTVHIECLFVGKGKLPFYSLSVGHVALTLGVKAGVGATFVPIFEELPMALEFIFGLREVKRNLEGIKNVPGVPVNFLEDMQRGIEALIRVPPGTSVNLVRGMKIGLGAVAAIAPGFDYYFNEWLGVWGEFCVKVGYYPLMKEVSRLAKKDAYSFWTVSLSFGVKTTF